MIIVTDSHISKASGNHSAFFKMLQAIEKTGHDLIFLGDIFDLWIALPRYEEEIHRRFIAWCRKQKSNRTIGFLEGNHEFYLANQRGQAFTWCSDHAWRLDEFGTLFVHGDKINPKDKGYLAFKMLTQNSLTRSILRHLPHGPKLVALIKRTLQNRPNKFNYQIPWKAIKCFADSRFAAGVTTIFMGHFHREYCYQNGNAKDLYVLPDWLSTQKLALYSKNSKKVRIQHWQELLSECET